MKVILWRLAYWFTGAGQVIGLSLHRYCKFAEVKLLAIFPKLG